MKQAIRNMRGTHNHPVPLGYILRGEEIIYIEDMETVDFHTLTDEHVAFLTEFYDEIEWINEEWGTVQTREDQRESPLFGIDTYKRWEQRQ